MIYLDELESTEPKLDCEKLALTQKQGAGKIGVSVFLGPFPIPAKIHGELCLESLLVSFCFFGSVR